MGGFVQVLGRTVHSTRQHWKTGLTCGVTTVLKHVHGSFLCCVVVSGTVGTPSPPDKAEEGDSIFTQRRIGVPGEHDRIVVDTFRVAVSTTSANGDEAPKKKVRISQEWLSSLWEGRRR